MHTLAMGTTFRNETPYLCEWIEYHRVVGATHFYLVNHDSGEELERSTAVLAPYVEAGLVTVLTHDDRSLQWQYHSWKAITDRAEGQTQWLCLTDADAFLFPVRADSVLPTLAAFDRPDIAGLAIYTCTFGSSWRDAAPRFQIEDLQRRAEMDHFSNWTANYILRPDRCEPSQFDRYAVPRPGYQIVDTNGFSTYGIKNKKRNGPKDVLRLNHYSIKSNADWLRKTARGWPGVEWHNKTETLAEHKRKMLDRNDVLDTSMDRFIPTVKKALGL